MFRDFGRAQPQTDRRVPSTHQTSKPSHIRNPETSVNLRAGSFAGLILPHGQILGKFTEAWVEQSFALRRI
jgi:hypothetical protein